MSPILLIYFASVAGLALFGLHRLFLLLVYLRVRRRSPSALEPVATLPAVTVQLPIYNERFVASRLLLAAARLDYARELLQIQVLDDSTDDTSRRLEVLTRRLRRLGLRVEHVRRKDRRGFKAGALARGLRSATGEIVALFDADFVPPRDFLRRVVPHFADPTVGMVQARWGHLNREVSLLTRLQSIFLDGHFHIEHVARHRTGRFFNFNGTAGAWRRATIDEAGGWQGDTLTEDLDLSYRAQLAGWRLVYLDELTSEAELPTDMNAFKAQQHRWAKGSVQTARKLLPLVLRSRIPWRVKLEALFHLTNNLTYLFMAIPCLLWVPTLSARYDTDRPWMIGFATAMAATTLCVISYHLTCQRAAGRGTWPTLRVLPALLSLGIGLSLNNGRAVFEALVGHRSPFLRTPKLGITDSTTRGRLPGQPELGGLAYRVRHDWLTWAELGLALYFALGLFIAIDAGRYVAIPFLLLFLFGFGYVGLASLGRRVDRLLAVGSWAACLCLLGFVLWVSTELLKLGG
jgi:cellulose synthase/poly-beta-1,6-N-acetylglucosamine synthase-like glycosyltransferase